MQEGSSPVEHYFECALQAAHSGAKGGSIQCAALFAHFADELGLKGGIIYVQNLTKGVAKEAWRDPAQDWLAGDPYRLPCELASDPGVQLGFLLSIPYMNGRADVAQQCHQPLSVCRDRPSKW